MRAGLLAEQRVHAPAAIAEPHGDALFLQRPEHPQDVGSGHHAATVSLATQMPNPFWPGWSRRITLGRLVGGDPGEPDWLCRGKLAKMLGHVEGEASGCGAAGVPGSG